MKKLKVISKEKKKKYQHIFALKEPLEDRLPKFRILAEKSLAIDKAGLKMLGSDCGCC